MSKLEDTGHLLSSQGHHIWFPAAVAVAGPEVELEAETEAGRHRPCPG